MTEFLAILNETVVKLDNHQIFKLKETPNIPLPYIHLNNIEFYCKAQLLEPQLIIHHLISTATTICSIDISEYVEYLVKPVVNKNKYIEMQKQFQTEQQIFIDQSLQKQKSGLSFLFNRQINLENVELEEKTEIFVDKEGISFKNYSIEQLNKIINLYLNILNKSPIHFYFLIGSDLQQYLDDINKKFIYQTTQDYLQCLHSVLNDNQYIHQMNNCQFDIFNIINVNRNVIQFNWDFNTKINISKQIFKENLFFDMQSNKLKNYHTTLIQNVPTYNTLFSGKTDDVISLIGLQNSQQYGYLLNTYLLQYQVKNQSSFNSILQTLCVDIDYTYIVYKVQQMNIVNKNMNKKINLNDHLHFNQTVSQDLISDIDFYLSNVYKKQEQLNLNNLIFVNLFTGQIQNVKCNYFEKAGFVFKYLNYLVLYINEFQNYFYNSTENYNCSKQNIETINKFIKCNKQQLLYFNLREKNNLNFATADFNNYEQFQLIYKQFQETSYYKLIELYEILKYLNQIQWQ